MKPSARLFSPCSWLPGMRLDGDHLRARIRLLQAMPRAHQRAACPEARDEYVDLRHVFQDLGAGQM